MRRRRQKNPLLARILLISVLVHIIALPIAARLGAFKKIQQQFMETRLVTLPPPETEKQKPDEKKTPEPPKKTAAVNKGNKTTPNVKQAAQKSNLTQPKVVATGPGDGAGGADSPAVAQGDPNAVGKIPTEKTETTPPTVKETPSIPPPVKETPPIKETPVKPTPPVIAKQPDPIPPVKPTPPVKPVEPPKAPVFTEVTATYSPQPSIPDDLRDNALDKTLVVEFTVSPEGTPTAVRVTQSTGMDELDRIALETARKWKFRPALRDGQPVESRVRLHIEFQVN